ncbi:MAG: DsbE family thiol:disulfide interchange protein [Betaproteobacteria bacterium]|nr:DsbE family thiol:disulfide interchange protein [Betaproteobacteria bacterium]
MNKFLWPLAGFIILAVFLRIGLDLNPHEVPSPFIGKPAPEFSLPVLGTPGEALDKHFSPRDMRGKVWLLNVWSSWCVSCRAEHPFLVRLAKEGKLPIVGFNYKEVRGDTEIDASKLGAEAERELVQKRARAWLAQRGDPYQLTVLDIDGRVAIDYGVYGVPETYLIDREGIIRVKHIGPLTEDALREKIMPLLEQETRGKP